MCLLYVVFSLFIHCIAPQAAKSETADVLQTNESAQSDGSTRDESRSPESESEIERKWLGSYPYRPRRNLIEGLTHLVDYQNLWTLGIGLGLVVSAKSSFDDDAQAYFHRQRRFGKHAEYLGNEILGTGVPGVLVGAGFWLFGDLFSRPYEMHAGQAQIETLFVTGLVTALMKGSFQRKRPDGSDYLSFPSGHTSTVFASAMVLQEFYGWKLGFPAFLLGGITAGSRMSDNRHWLSDTVASATIGMMIGHAYSTAHLGRISSFGQKKQSKVSIVPIVLPGGGQIVFRYQN